MNKKNFPNTNIEISPLGFGALILSSRLQNNFILSSKILNYVINNGINFIDTAISYGVNESDNYNNEKLISEIIKNNNNVIIATKGGVIKENNSVIFNSDPSFLRTSCERSLKNLNVEHIKLYQLHALDNKTPIKDIAYELNKLKDEGKILNIGLSNVDIKDVFEFSKYIDIFSVQNKFNPFFQKDLKTNMLNLCKDKNITFFSYGIFHNINPNINDKLNNLLNRIAEKYNTTSYIISLLWIKSKGENIIPIISSTNLLNIEECINSINIKLEKEDINLIDSF